MPIDLTIALLTRTPATLDALLRDLPDAWTLRNEAENTWSAFDVVGHLIHGERTDWLPRTKIILECGESRPFDAFDRWGHVKEVGGKTLDQLLDEFARLRSANLDELRALNLSTADLEKRGRHPALGVVTLSQAALYLGRPRSDASTPNLPHPGAPVPRGRGSLDSIPRRDAVQRAWVGVGF